MTRIGVGYLLARLAVERGHEVSKAPPRPHLWSGGRSYWLHARNKAEARRIRADLWQQLRMWFVYSHPYGVCECNNTSLPFPTVPEDTTVEAFAKEFVRNIKPKSNSRRTNNAQ
jgi:hypothetical protein